MIIKKSTKGYEIVDTKPNENFYPEEDNYIVNEMIESGIILREQIKQLYPNYDFDEIDGEYLLSIIEIVEGDPRYIPKELPV